PGAALQRLAGPQWRGRMRRQEQLLHLGLALRERVLRAGARLGGEEVERAERSNRRRNPSLCAGDVALTCSTCITPPLLVAYSASASSARRLSALSGR